MKYEVIMNGKDGITVRTIVKDVKDVVLSSQTVTLAGEKAQEG